MTAVTPVRLRRKGYVHMNKHNEVNCQKRITISSMQKNYCFRGLKNSKKMGKNEISRSSLIYNTSARYERHERHECNTNATLATRARHERQMCDTSATITTRVQHEWKILMLITTRVKTYHTLLFTIWQVKDYKERNNFILRTTFWKCLVSMPKCV